jgi:hypothetical protein
MKAPITRAKSRPRLRFRGEEVVRVSARMLRDHAPALILAIVALYWLPVTALDYAARFAFGTAGYARWYLLARTGVGLVLIEFLWVAAAAAVLPEAGPRLGAIARAATVTAKQALVIAPLGLAMNVSGFLGGMAITSSGAGSGAGGLWVAGVLTAGLINIVIQFAAGVAAPVMAAEADGVWATLARSARLLAGHRWAVLGFWTAVTVSRGLFNQLAGVLVQPLPPTSLIRETNLVLLVAGAGLVVWGVVCAAVYRELLRVKDAGPHRAIADVFD